MALDATIVEVPKPPAGRLPFLRLLARLVSNPVASWGEDFYDEPIVVYRDFGLETVFVTDPELTQQILLDDSDAFTKSPLYDNVLGRAGGKGLLIAEGDDWRWQRRIAAPLFRAEAILSYAPAFAAACEPVLTRWREAAPGSLQIIGKDMTDAAMQALQDTILGAGSRGAGAQDGLGGGNCLSELDHVEDRLCLAEIAVMDSASRRQHHAAGRRQSP